MHCDFSACSSSSWPMQAIHRSEGFPTRDICFLHAVLQGSYQMGRVVGTPSLSPSVGFTGGPPPPDPPSCLPSKGAGHQNVRSHTRMLGPSVYPAYLARGRVIRMLGPMPACLVLQCFQIHRSYPNAWSFSISRFTGHFRMRGPPMHNV